MKHEKMCYNGPMVESLNTRADLAVDAIAYLGLPKYGKIMIGDNALEFFNNRNVADTMQFPWKSIKNVEGWVSRRGKVDKYFYIVLPNGHKIRFSSAETGKILKLIREQIGNDRVVRRKTLPDVLFGWLKRKK